MGEGSEEGPENLIARRACQQQLFDFPAQHADDIGQWAERARRGEWVAGPDEDARRVPGRLREVRDKGCLANARLATEEHEAAVPGGGFAQPPIEFRENGIALQQCHSKRLPQYGDRGGA